MLDARGGLREVVHTVQHMGIRYIYRILYTMIYTTELRSFGRGRGLYVVGALDVGQGAPPTMLYSVGHGSPAHATARGDLQNIK